MTNNTSTNWHTSSVLRPKYSTTKDNKDHDFLNAPKGVTLNQMFQNNIVVNRKMVKTGQNEKRQDRSTNKSVHWSQNHNDLTEESRNFARDKRRSLGSGYESKTVDSLNPVSIKQDNLRMAESVLEMREYTGPKINAMSVTPEVITQWIKDTLEDAAYFEIPGAITNAKNRSILGKIDRDQLSKNGVPDSAISRLYRCLFVYSIGFNEMLKTILSHSKDKVGLTSSVWKVFSVLLEYWCKSDYKAIINEQEDQHEKILSDLEKRHDNTFKEFGEEIERLKDENQTLIQFADKCEKEKRIETKERQRIEEEQKDKLEQFEYEVKLRLQFEAKLNSMHSAHRMIEGELKIARKLKQNMEEEIEKYK
jgi:hypothetical protein